MAFDLYPAVDENYEFPTEVREANALTPEFRSQVVPMTETQRNNLSGAQLWTHRMIFNTTTFRINRYNGSSWSDLAGEAPGIIKMYAGATAPDGHALCQGQVVSRSGIYAALFTVVGTQFNTGGELSTEFRLPNFKGRVPLGVDSGDASFNVLGETGGEKTHTLTSAEMPAHTHVQDAHGHDSAADGGHEHATHLGDTAYTQSGGSLTKSYNASPGDNTFPSGAHDHPISNTTATNQNTGGGGAHNNLQPYLAVNFIITL